MYSSKMAYIKILLFLLFFIGQVQSKSYSTCQSHFLPYQTNQHARKIRNILAFSNLHIKPVTIFDNRYDDIRRHSIDIELATNASFIFTPSNFSDILIILNQAVQYSLRPTIRSGAHCYLDFWANNPGGVLIDLSHMNNIYTTSNDQNTIWIEPGMKLMQLYPRLYKEYGLTIPAGVCLDVAVGGHVAGAGYGYLARKFGLISDYVNALEIIHVKEDKSVGLLTVGRNSTDENEKNLFWALQGGGHQNFGVITKVGFIGLPQSPELIYKYQAEWTLGKEMDKWKFMDFLDKYIRFFIENSSPESEYCDIFAEIKIGRKNGEAYMMLRIMLVGDKKKLVQEFLSNLGLTETEISKKVACDEMSYFRFTNAIGERNDLDSDGKYYTHRSAYMVGPIPSQQKSTIWQYITDPSYSSIQDGSIDFRSYGCAVSRVSEDTTAYPHRNAKLKIQYVIIWDNPDQSETHLQWTRNFYRAMYGQMGPRPDGTMDGCFMNYPDQELMDWQHLYFKNNYERLMKVKKQWDPLNIFHHRQSIELPNDSRYSLGSSRNITGK